MPAILTQHHPAPDAAADGRLSVGGKIDAGLRPEEREDAVERRIGRRVVSRGFSHRRVPPDRGELFADPLRGNTKSAKPDWMADRGISGKRALDSS